MPTDYRTRREVQADSAWASILLDLDDPRRQIDPWRVMAVWLHEIRQQTAILAVIAQQLGARVGVDDVMRDRESHDRLHGVPPP